MKKHNKNTKILQIIPAPFKSYALFEGEGKEPGSTPPLACLALIERPDGFREVVPMCSDGFCIDFAEEMEGYIGVAVEHPE